MDTWDSIVTKQWALAPSPLGTWFHPQRAPKPRKARLPLVTGLVFLLVLPVWVIVSLGNGGARLFLASLMLVQSCVSSLNR